MGPILRRAIISKYDHKQTLWALKYLLFKDNTIHLKLFEVVLGMAIGYTLRKWSYFEIYKMQFEDFEKLPTGVIHIL